MNIPLLDLKREYLFLKKEIDKQLEDCFATQQWVLGGKVSELEGKISKYLGSKYAIGVNSGTDALVLSLRSLAIKLKKKNYFDKKDEIITTPFTFIATVESIVNSGATPVLVDIDPDTFNISPQAVKKAITKNTVGIIPVHLYGLSCDMDEILKVAKENNLFIIEDVAQSFGATYKKKKLGTLGDYGAFSFFPSKNLGSYGDGGLVVTNNKKLFEYIKSLRNHGQSKQYDATYLGYNSRLDSIQAAVLLAKLKYIDRFNNLRRKIAHQYNKDFAAIKQIKTPVELKNSISVYHLYTLKVLNQRDNLLKYLNSFGIEARVYYPKLINEMEAFKG
ncbi:MAG: DegT/DnrJ/EryC1/StrS family aminotransferase, partial [Candidatus Omnitrophica bacterium]|nr:DegT/DnrJ/EryC1/StrS family aminotransferase [Candidatus Omnitrophota bacterium]